MMQHLPETRPHRRPSVFLSLLPISAAVFVGFLTIGLALPVLPLHVSGTLGLGAVAVGVLVGAQFAAALVSRVWAGGHADTRGAKRAMATGFVVAAAAGGIYLLSLRLADRPDLSFLVLLAGRVVLGCAESFVATGALGWGVGLVGPQNAGRVMVWVGIAMFAAYAAGAPVGTFLYEGSGFAAIALATALVPLLGLAMVAPVRAVAPPTARRPPFYKVLGAVWLPGLGLAFSSIGFGAITAFVALLFAFRGWQGASFAFTAFGAAFIVARLLFGHLPDRIGGAKVALACVAIEAVGQLLIWAAPVPAAAHLGAACTGFGYSLAFPGFGVEAVRRAPPASRALAMGAYVAFLDLSLGLASPALGFVAGHQGMAAVYLASAAAVACAVPVAARLLSQPAAASRPRSPDGGAVRRGDMG